MADDTTKNGTKSKRFRFSRHYSIDSIIYAVGLIITLISVTTIVEHRITVAEAGMTTSQKAADEAKIAAIKVSEDLAVSNEKSTREMKDYQEQLLRTLAEGQASQDKRFEDFVGSMMSLHNSLANNVIGLTANQASVARTLDRLATDFHDHEVRDEQQRLPTKRPSSQRKLNE